MMVVFAVVLWLALPTLVLGHNWTEDSGELKEALQKNLALAAGLFGGLMGGIAGAMMRGSDPSTRQREQDEESDADDLPPELFRKTRDAESDEESDADDLPPELFRKRRDAESDEESDADDPGMFRKGGPGEHAEED